MEVFASSTPTYSGNCKANLESSQDETLGATSCRAASALVELVELVKRDTQLLACGYID